MFEGRKLEIARDQLSRKVMQEMESVEGVPKLPLSIAHRSDYR